MPTTEPPQIALPAAPVAIIVTGSRTERSPAGALSAIDRSEIGRKLPFSLLDVLNDVPGIRAFSTGGAGGRTFLSIRGGEPNFTMVLLNGIRLNDPTNSRGGGFDFFLIDPSLVERIEIVREPASPIYGSDALSGVVSVTLLSPVEKTTAVGARAQAGAVDDADLASSLRTGWRDGGLILGGSSSNSGHATSGSSLERTQALSEVRQQLGGFEAKLTAVYGHAQRSAFAEDSGGPRFAATRERERGTSEFLAAGASVRRDDDAALRPNLSLTWSRIKDDSSTPAIPAGLLQGTPALSAATDFTRFEAIGDVGIGRGPVVTSFGASWMRESGRNAGTIDLGFPLPVRFDLARRTISAFAETSVRPVGRLSFNFAGRYDRTGRAGRVTTRAGATWQLKGGPSLFLRFATGYKLPSFFSLAHPLIGNPSLRPERSENVEAGLERSGVRLSFRMTVFRNVFRNLIDFDPGLFKLVNRDRVIATGAELQGRWRPFARLELEGGLTGLDLKSPTPLRGRPNWQGNLRATWQAWSKLQLYGEVGMNSHYFDSSIPTGLVRARGHGQVDVGLRYAVRPRLDVVIVGANVTGARYEDAVGFPAPRRQLRVALEYRWL